MPFLSLSYVYMNEYVYIIIYEFAHYSRTSVHTPSTPSMETFYGLRNDTSSVDVCTADCKTIFIHYNIQHTSFIYTYDQDSQS